MTELTFPFTKQAVRALKIGDAVSITGPIHTGRDKFHKYFADGGKLPLNFQNGALYHCGPVIVGKPGAWKVVAAGPTTSVRENPYEPSFIKKTGVRLIIGKGGMDAATLAAMKKCACVYIAAVGGAAALAAQSVQQVEGVDFLDEFGPAEACWHFNVKGFRGIVAMDAHGHSLFEQVQNASKAKLNALL